jgi:uncharacterized Zn finger protein
METDDGSLSRGRAYAREGRVDIVERSPVQVTAVERGTTSYDVSVTADHAFCTCPVGITGAICKHVVAVVLTEDSDDAPGPAAAPAATPAEDTAPAPADLLERHRRRPTLIRLLTSMPAP